MLYIDSNKLTYSFFLLKIIMIIIVKLKLFTDQNMNTEEPIKKLSKNKFRKNKYFSDKGY